MIIAQYIKRKIATKIVIKGTDNDILREMRAIADAMKNGALKMEGQTAINFMNMIEDYFSEAREEVERIIQEEAIRGGLEETLREKMEASIKSDKEEEKGGEEDG